MFSNFHQDLKDYTNKVGIETDLKHQLPSIITPGVTPDSTCSTYDRDMDMFVSKSNVILLDNDDIDFIFYKRHWLRPSKFLGYYQLPYSDIQNWKISDKENTILIKFSVGSLMLMTNNNKADFINKAGRDKEYSGPYREFYKKLLKLEDQSSNNNLTKN